MTIPKAPKHNRIKPKRFTCKVHTHYVWELQCLACHGPSEKPHHLLRDVVRGMGRKASDVWQVPLCDYHHREVHLGKDGEKAFEKKYKLDFKAVCRKLVADSPSQKAKDEMENVK